MVWSQEGRWEDQGTPGSHCYTLWVTIPISKPGRTHEMNITSIPIRVRANSSGCLWVISKLCGKMPASTLINLEPQSTLNEMIGQELRFAEARV